MKLTNQTIVYSINVEDLQSVAQENLGRSLSARETKLVSDCVGDYIDWVHAIESAIRKIVKDA